jgi:hypothetical protein
VPRDDEREDHALSNAPEYVQNMREAEREIAAGLRGTPLNEALPELTASDDEYAALAADRDAEDVAYRQAMRERQRGSAED